MNPDRLRAPPIELPSYKPGTVVMNPRQYNKLCDAGLIRVRTATGRKPEYFWNDVPLVLSDNMPPDGWFIVPGGAPETVEHTVVVQKPKDDDE